MSRRWARLRPSRNNRADHTKQNGTSFENSHPAALSRHVGERRKYYIVAAGAISSAFRLLLGPTKANKFWIPALELRTRGDISVLPLKRYFVAVILVSSIGVAAQTAPSPHAAAPATLQLDHFNPAQVDPNSDPCVDFYQYTCKKWIANNPIPPDQANWWLGSKLMIWNQALVRQILDAASTNDPKRNSSDQKIGDYYESCMNEDEINKKGIAAIQPELDRINALRDKSELPA